MSEWYFVLAPVAVLVVLSLVRFVGCGGEDFTSPPDFPRNYAQVVGLDFPVAYWRLQEQKAEEPSAPSVTNLPVVGGTAVDVGTAPSLGSFDGTYKAIKTEPPTMNPPFPLDTPWSPGGLLLERPGLLELPGQQSTSLYVDGGYVEVPYATELALGTFSVEALVRPGWDPSESGLYRSVITFCSVDITPEAPKGFGFGLFAGPDPNPDPNNPGDVWQIWLGNGPTFTRQEPNEPFVKVNLDLTSYLCITYDKDTKVLNMYVYVSGIGMSSNSFPLYPSDNSTYSPVSDPTQSLLIGMHRPPVVPGGPGPFPLYHPFKGHIQEVAIYGAALAPEGAKGHAEAALMPYGP
jgi:hypothetical protein